MEDRQLEWLFVQGGDEAFRASLLARSGSGNDELRRQQELKFVAQEAAAAAARKVVSEFKRQRLSGTDYADIGKELLEAWRTPKPQLLPVWYTPLPGHVDRKFKNDWKDTTNEDGVQVLATKLFQAIRKAHYGRRQSRFVLDTHNKSFYSMPTGKVDLALSASKEAFWTTLESCTELKYRLSSEDDYTTAIGQVYTAAQHMFDAQPQREHIIQCIAGKDAVELWRFERSGIVWRSGKEPLEWQPDATGYQLLMSYLAAPAASLGYIPSTPLQQFQVRLLCGQTVLLDNCTPIANIPNRRLVYKASCRNQDAPVVVKFGAKGQIEHELEIMQQKQLAGPGMPQVLAVGDSSGFCKELQRLVGELSHYYVMEPFGVHITKDLPPRLKLSALLDVCDVVQRLTEQHYLHRDLSPDNIVIAKVGDKWRGFLLDYHVAALKDAQASHQLSGKPRYWALKLHAVAAGLHTAAAGLHTEQTDVESLFYTLLEWASGGLPWRHVVQEGEVYDMKFRRMFSRPAWEHVLRRCDQQLQPVLSSLHMQIFGTREADYDQHSVSVQQVRATVQPVYQQLLQQIPELDDALVWSQPDYGLLDEVEVEGSEP